MTRREYLNRQEKPFYQTALLRKVVPKNVPASIPKGNMGYDQYTVPVTLSLSYYTYICCLPLPLANISPSREMLSNFLSLKNSYTELKTTHNTFRNCRVHFF